MSTDDNADHSLITLDSPDGNQGPPAVADDVLPDTLVILPLPGRPFFPGQVQPIGLDPEQWRTTLEAINKQGSALLGLAFVGDRDPAEVAAGEIPEMGCVVRLHRPPIKGESPGQFLAQGLRRFSRVRWLQRDKPMIAQVEYPRAKDDPDSDEVKAYSMAIIASIKELLPLNPLYSEELKQYLGNFNPNQPSLLADFAAAMTSAKGDKLQDILETLPLAARMAKVLELLKREKEVAELQGQITHQVNEKVSDNQREFFLREQMKVIQKELGISKDDRTSDAERFEDRLQKLDPPKRVLARVDDELAKLKVLESGSPEYAVTRNYLDWVTSVPWGVYSEDNLELAHARQTLDAHHDGLEDVKKRIVEFLAVGNFKGQIDGSILLLVGPPGVGKTSIGRSIADALGRKFYRFSLGGMRDEAEIKGHRRTYIGAMPGKLVQALKEVEVANPVIMLDEIDKIGASYQGDPASALLEVLDPEQNSDFLDHYLDLRLDLSKVLFVCTANQLDTIPGPLLDRMETIRLAGYIAEEKLAIAKHHLWPKLLERHGVEDDQVKLNDAALKLVIESYCREAGVRSLEKQLAKLIRKSIVRIVDGESEKVRLGKKEVGEMLGQPRFRTEKPSRGRGVVTGLAWTAAGGATLAIESSKIHTLNRGFKLTGQLGDVMKESAEIAYSYVVANLREFGGDADFFDMSMVHLHVPEGATPKDGPSAGITMATALVSLARRARIRRSLAMTGELTLTGRVLTVGGIREKVIAARRSKIPELLLPHDNKGDYEELPDYLKEGLTVHFVRTFREVVDIVFDTGRDSTQLH
ncbi:ATP-dependent protease La [Luminiphilus syltensis NOR5-1B]|uniref:Lon protease n=1 Tax=Luminiphilus syltensis NOR5-1B TaxID=565045 RepID=B8KRU9_9GAMM|nr:endopeptidase La [Luminiphilus syltensis]EED36619.1 ATP-dependent protease La [Luminiphilus syltensis NOR5-1B]